MGRRNKRDQDAGEPAPKFTRDMLVADAVNAHPQVKEVLREYALPCDECIVAWHESLAEGCTPLGLNVDTIVARLNAL